MVEVRLIVVWDPPPLQSVRPSVREGEGEEGGISKVERIRKKRIRKSV